MREVSVIDDPATAATVLDDLRSRILKELVEPASAAALAQRLGLPRQKVNYHLRALENHGLATVAEERKHGGLTERLLVASARSYVVSPLALRENAPDPKQTGDALSAQYLIALAARLVNEVGELSQKAQADESRLATLAVDTEISFQSAEDQAAFVNELTQSITSLTAKYHTDGGREYRVVVGSHPIPHEEDS